MTINGQDESFDARDPGSGVTTVVTKCGAVVNDGVRDIVRINWAQELPTVEIYSSYLYANNNFRNYPYVRYAMADHDGTYSDYDLTTVGAVGGHTLEQGVFRSGPSEYLWDDTLSISSPGSALPPGWPTTITAG